MNKLIVSILAMILLSTTMVRAQEQTQESRPWRMPSFSNQKRAMGYQAEAFAIPRGMEAQVQFWVDIYSKYTTNQGVLHDSEDFSKIYEIVDLTGLNTPQQHQRRVDEVKKRLGAKLGIKDPVNSIRFQLGQKDRMQDAIFYSGRYLEEMEEIFRDARIPVELTRLAFVESSFNIMARSRVGASGLWQIMPYTAKPYRMISSTVDKRNHPIEATRVAARILKSNFGMLDSWPLAVTGYNHGPTGVRKMTNKYKSRELPDLINNVRSRKSFGFASRNFYACFLAVLEVERNANKYFGDTVVWSKKLDSRDLKLPKAITYKELLAWFGGDDRKTQIYNPHLTQKVRKGTPIPARSIVAIPADKYDVALISLAKGKREVAMESN